MKLNDKQLDTITKHVVFHIIGIVATLVFVIAAVALAGPQLAPLMNKLPW